MVEFISNITLPRRVDDPIRDVIFPLMHGDVLKFDDAIRIATLWSLSQLKQVATHARSLGEDELAATIEQRILELI